ncbi:hypothetical protein OIU84_000851 [Salix udensis]|uniref:Uncharacterized protein n=1 Tax=Salix udensis TaxID=889485 RepID=A0AAD6PPE8_9ROSI|nr:hypothetical protein OIU84_000851 [Salix udensis]
MYKLSDHLNTFLHIHIKHQRRTVRSKKERCKILPQKSPASSPANHQQSPASNHPVHHNVKPLPRMAKPPLLLEVRVILRSVIN